MRARSRWTGRFRMDAYYTTIEAVALHQAQNATPAHLQPSDTKSITQLWRAIRGASAIISERTQRVFVPHRKTLTVGQECLYAPDVLKLPETILEGESVASASLSKLDGVPSRFLRRTDGNWNFPTLVSKASVAAVYGYHTDYANAWRDIESVSIDAVSDELNVTESTDYERGDLLRIDTEYVLAVAHISATKLQVKRGVNGTTAAAHIAATVAIYQQMQDVRFVATEIAAWLYKTRDKVSEVIALPGGSTVTVGNLAPDIYAPIDKYHPLEENKVPYR